MPSTLELTSATTQLQLENESLKKKVIERTEALLAARAELSVLERMKREFITLVSHEMRTPLTSVVGMADLIMNGLYESPQELLAMVQTISNEGTRLTRFVDDTIEFLQWVSGQVSLRLAPLRLRDEVDEVVRKLLERYAERQLKATVTGDADLVLLADRAAIRNCLGRVLDNAMKFSYYGGEVSISMERVPGAGTGEWAQVIVRDQGQGISSEKIEELYKILTLCHSYQNHTRGGGLGLAIAREILRSHGGKIRIESPGRGLGCEASLSFPLGAGANAERR